MQENQDDLEETLEIRTRQQTAKGKEFQIELLKDHTASAQRAWRKQLNKIENVLADSENASLLQSERILLETKMEILVEAHERLDEALEDNFDEKHVATQKFETWEHEHTDALRRLNQRISELKQEERSLRSSRSGRTSRGQRSSKASSTPTSDRKADMAAKVAKLKTELIFAEAEAERAAALKEHEEKLKRLQLKKELAVAKAEMDAVTKVEENEFGMRLEDLIPEVTGKDDLLQSYLKTQAKSVSAGSQQTLLTEVESLLEPPLEEQGESNRKSDTEPANSAPAKEGQRFTSHKGPAVSFSPYPSTSKPLAPGYLGTSTPKSESSRRPFSTQLDTVNPFKKNTVPNGNDDLSHSKPSSEGALERLADLLSQRRLQDSLPLPEPEIFRGDLLHYPFWVKSFKTIIEDQTHKAAQRLFYLGKYTAGEAREAINGFLSLETSEAYTDAKKVLSDRFGNPFLIADAYRKKINEWPRIQPNDGTALRKYSDFLLHCQTAAKEIHYLKILDDPDENQKMAKKLPRHLIDRWSREVDRWLNKEQKRDDDLSPQQDSAAMYPPFSAFCKFVKQEARIACNPVISSKTLREEESKKEDVDRTLKGNKIFRRRNCFGTGANEVKHDIERNKKEDKPKRESCSFCKGPHFIDVCNEFTKLTLPEKMQFIRARGLCHGCLRWGHLRKDCRQRKNCASCRGPHPTLLHDDTLIKDKQDTNGTVPVATSHRIEASHSKGHAECYSHSLIVPVWLRHEQGSQEKELVYALLDDQSDACFIKESVLKKLQLSGPQVQLRLSTVLAEEVVECERIDGLTVQSLNEATSIRLPGAYSREDIPAKRGQIPRPETARNWPHLVPIAEQLMPYREDIEVGLLIGANCTRAIKPTEVIPGREDDPYAKKTALGWGVIGVVNPIKNEDDGHCSCHRIASLEVNPSSGKRMCHFALKTKVKEIFQPVEVMKMFETDFHEASKDGQALSHDDRKFIKKAKEGIHRRNDGHYELPLPLRDERMMLPNNKELALSRIKKLKGRLKHDSTYRKDYQGFMSEIIEKGYAERVPPEELSLDNGRIWYIPHHGVYHPKKPGKIRVVFDASAECKGESLNKHLLQGPDLTNSLTGVLCRFRKEPVAFICDIEGMFHQVNVNYEHRNLLRFLWWEQGDIEKSLVEYRMTVHLFGAVSSPGCANFALKTTADDFEEECGNDAAEFVRHDFYVDDGLKSVPSVEHAINLIESTKTLCKKGGFNLHKFISNRREVIEAIPVEQRAKEIKELDMTKDLLPIERALGVQWFVESDELHFRAELKDRPLTRRGILSTVSSVYDPLGLISPFLLKGKIILQGICKDGAHWDDPIPDPVRMQWVKWREDFGTLARLKIPRCYKPVDFGEVKSVELHNFSDASTSGYGQCSYLKMTNLQGKIHCTLAMAKSRVTPSKPITVPRLELTAALLSVKISSFLKKELKFGDIPEVFWTDSEVVRGYVSNDSRRFHTFVANRVQSIRDYSEPNQWKRVDTKKNPADEASRGLSAEELLNSPRWWSGPDFLWKPHDDQAIDEVASISEDDPEVKKISSFAIRTKSFASLLDRLQSFSDWHQAKRAVALCLRLQRRFKKGKGEQESTVSKTPQGQKGAANLEPVSVEELHLAEIEIIKASQKEAFQQELAYLQDVRSNQEREKCSLKKGPMKKVSPIRRLDPFKDQDGILRVGGRIRHADLPFQEKHPLILPKRGHVTDLVIRHHHAKSHHQGRGITHASIRSSGVWIISGNSAVGHHISKCVKCRRYRGAPQAQKMADLPADRVEENPPFTYSAVDYFGPFYIKEGRRELKRYGVLFTCMSSRAVHLETAASLTADSFLSAYRRFIGRRGPVRQLRSDQGTNFVGASNELKAALSEMNQDTLKKEMARTSCDWIVFKMDVPSASHMGGAWERQIRTVRSVLSALLDDHGRQLDDESLQTLMIEAESIVNSRPLTTDETTCKETPDVLTPNHLLTQKSQVVLPPPGVFQRADLYSRKRWRRVQHLANEFWQRWRKSFLQSLQSRQKWTTRHRNLQVDEVVILKDDSSPRNLWKLARVDQTYPDDDGLVRKVRIAVADDSLDKEGRRTRAVTFLERPIQKLILLLPADSDEDRGIPIEEPHK